MNALAAVAVASGAGGVDEGEEAQAVRRQRATAPQQRSMRWWFVSTIELVNINLMRSEIAG
jgi:hypothetical protein